MAGALPAELLHNLPLRKKSLRALGVLEAHRPQSHALRFQFRNRRRLTVLQLNTLFPASPSARKNIKMFVDSSPTHSTRKWSRTALPATRKISGPAQLKLLYKSSGPNTASAQHSRRRKCDS
jgi:hypothetical protein